MEHKELLSEDVRKSWKPVIEAEGVDPIQDITIRNNTVRLLENTKRSLAEVAASNIQNGLVDTNPEGISKSFDTTIISMVRRSMPVLISNDIMGTQPMTAPTGLAFAINSSRVAGTGVAVGGTSGPTYGPDGYILPDNPKIVTGDSEQLGVGQTSIDSGVTITPVNQWASMTFQITRTSVEAKTRAMKAQYTQELAQDLKAVHGIDADSELANMLSGELVAEINRELVATVRSEAITSLAGTVAGEFDLAVDTDARWQYEAIKGLYFHMEKESNIIGQATGRGKGNFIIVSANIASAFEAAMKMDTAPLGGNIAGGWTGISFAGVLQGKYKVWIDPYMTDDHIVIGFKGAGAYDAGYFYCPYVPLQMMRSTGEEDFQPRIGFKTRYGMIANPNWTGGAGTNAYYRTFEVKNL